MKTRCLFPVACVVIGIAGAANVSVARAEEPVVDRVEVTFHTTNDDKDDDTKLQVWLLKGHDPKAGEEIAGDDNVAPGKCFHDWKDNGPFVLPVKNAYKRDELKNLTVKVKIIPHGNDTWRFHFTLRVFYKDGTDTLVEDGAGGENGLELNEGDTIGNYRLVLPSK